MKTYIHIKNDGILIVKKQGKKVSYSELEIPHGAILNGVIMNAQALKTVLNTMVPKPKKVELIIDSSNIMAKKLNTPVVSENNISKIVKGEFNLYDKEESYHIDGTIIKSGTSLSVMGYAVSNDMVDAYTSLFQECSIKVTRIDIVINGVINYISKQEKLSDKTFIFNILMGEIMLSLLFEKGEFKLANRTRLLKRNDGDSLYQELYMKLSSMNQFNQSERSSHTIEESYYVGLSAEEFEGFKAYTTGTTAISIQNYKDTALDLNYFYPSLLGYAKKKDINLIVNKENVTNKKKKVMTGIIKVLLVFVILGLLTSYLYSLFNKYQILLQENEQLSTYISSPEVVDSVAEFDNLQDKNTRIIEIKTTIESVLEKNKTINPVSKTLLTQVFDTEKINSLYYSYNDDTNKLSISGESKKSEDAVKYATDLREGNFFHDMQYKGYVREKDKIRYWLTVYAFDIEANFNISNEEVTENDN